MKKSPVVAAFALWMIASLFGQNAIAQEGICPSDTTPTPGGAKSLPYRLNEVKLDQQASPGSASNFMFISPNKSLASLTAVVGATPGFVMVFDAASLPANGAVTSCTNAAAARPCVMWCAPVAANAFVNQQWNTPMSFTTGVLVAFSTTGCTSITASATAQFFGEAP